MTYSYSAGNFLQDPPTYMYTAFEGEGFLSCFATARQAAIDTLLARFDSTAAAPGSEPDNLLEQAWVDFLLPSFCASALPMAERLAPLLAGIKTAPMPPAAASVGLDHWSLQESVATRPLLLDLLSVPMAGGADKIWLDRLIQRFEVTKKLYTVYLPGFRKGEGAYDDLSVYRCFALALVLAYRQSHNLKQLNALLKVNDLLISLLPRAAESRPALLLVLTLLLAEQGYVRELMGAERGRHAF